MDASTSSRSAGRLLLCELPNSEGNDDIMIATMLRLISVAVISMSCVSGTPLSAGDQVNFEPVLGFLKLPDGMVLGNCSAVAVDSRGEIYVYHRGTHPILCFDADGNYLRSWGDDVIGMAHGLRVDRDDNVWVTDVGRHRVLKFDRQGKLLLALGNGTAGIERDQFDKPTDMAFGPAGEIYVTDGYGNTRVMKFAADGTWIKSWGTPGKAPGEFNTPHCIVIDGKGRLLVGDRENDRIQVYDQEGTLLAVWNGFAPYGLTLDAAGRLFVTDGRANKVLLLDDAGKIQQSWGRKGSAAGEFQLPHMLAFDAAGNLLIAEVDNKRLQKFVRK